MEGVRSIAPSTTLRRVHAARMNHPISLTPEAGGASSPSVASLTGTPPTLLAEVYVYIGQDLLAKYSIEHGEYLIGRDENCHICIDADRISRHHARLSFNSYELVIEDLGSANGVLHRRRAGAAAHAAACRSGAADRQRAAFRAS